VRPWPGMDWGNTTPPWPTNWARLVKVKNLALVSDIAASKERIAQAHKTGVNVLYGNGGAKWVDLKLVKQNIDLCGFDFTQPSKTSNNTQQRLMWEKFDRY